MEHDDALDDNDVLVAGLGEGLSYSEAGRLVGVSGRTVQRRMTDPEFARRVSAARTARLEELIGRLGELSAKALTVLDEAMDSSQPMRTRLAATSMTLRTFQNLRSVVEVEERLREVEELMSRLALAVSLMEDE